MPPAPDRRRIVAAVAMLLGATLVVGLDRSGRAAPAPPRAAAPVPKPARPDIVVFLADDLGLHDVGAYGGRDARTPNIDRLARAGQSYDRAFVASPACGPSRAALLTGLMPARTGAEANHEAPRRSIAKLPAYLQAQGYEVVAFGKVAHYEQTPQYGFDHAEHFTFHDPAGIPSAIDWLKKRGRGKPLAIFVGSNWPHVPWPRTSEGYRAADMVLPGHSVDTPITRDARTRYLAAVTRLDTELGRFMAVSDAVLGPDTFVLFSSDHGAQWPFAKWNLYDTGTRVPLIVRWRGHVRANTRTRAMVSWVDILPTLVDVAGGPPAAGLDGRSFVPVVTGTTAQARTEIYTTHTGDGRVNVYPIRSVRTGRWKYIRNLHPDWTYTTHIDQFDKPLAGGYFASWRAAAAHDARAKAIVDRYYSRPAEELYDLSADPGETHNLAGDARHAATRRDLGRRLDRWLVAQGDTGRMPDVPPHLDRSRPAAGAQDGAD